LEHVWGYSADPMTNIVDVYIRQLSPTSATQGKNAAN